MKIRLVRRIAKEDLQRQGDIPGWIDSLLSPINEFFDNVISALRNRLTFEDNFQCQVVNLTFDNGAEKTVSVANGFKIKGIIPIIAEGTEITSFKVVRRANGGAGITLGLGKDSATCTVVILLETL